MTTQSAPIAPASCALCPRRCHVDRSAGATGVCGADGTLRVARAALHMWEEPPISGEAGSGTIFFSGCSLKCVFCQNHEISTGNFGLKIEPERLVQIMLELQEQGALNINLVTATHYAHLLPWAIGRAREEGLSIPIVYNTSGYELEQAVRDLGDLVDVWLTDYKYASPDLAAKLSNVHDYPGVARRGLAQMCRDVPISVMNQYTPNDAMRAAGGDLARAVTDEEYERVLDYADDLGFTTMFWQEGGAVDESFTPAFDTTGVLRAADA